MNPVIIMALAKLAMGATQLGAGLSGAANNKRPDYNIPDEAIQLLDVSSRRASESLLPAQGYYENQINRTEGGALTSARSTAQTPAQLLEAATSIQSNTNQSLESLAIAGAERKDRNFGQFESALKLMAEYRDKEFQFEELIPFQERAATNSANIGAGIQNLYGAADSYGSMMLQDERLTKILEELTGMKEGTGDSGGDDSKDNAETMTEAIDSGSITNIFTPKLGSLLTSWLSDDMLAGFFDGSKKEGDGSKSSEITGDPKIDNLLSSFLSDDQLAQILN